MQQKRSGSRLGQSLKKARKAAGLTQEEVAEAVDCNPRTVWHAERGQGRADLFQRIANCVGMVVSGRALPPGDLIGPRLKMLRARVGISRTQVADECGLSPTTVADAEAGGSCNISTLEQIGAVLGAGLTLVASGEHPGFYQLVGISSGWNAWSTPQPVLDSLCRVVGNRFDLDPCASRQKRHRIHARRYLTEDDDGLSQPWHGHVYINPPYGPQIALWTAKAMDEVTARRADVVIGLVPARTDTRWWHTSIAGRSDVWLLRGRLAFGGGEQKAPFPSAIVVWGATEDVCCRMTAEFPDAWHVPGRRP